MRFLLVTLLLLQGFAGGSRVLAQDSEPGFNPAGLEAMANVVRKAIAAKKLPGGVLWLEHEGSSHHEPFGNRRVVPAAEPMTEDTIFDAASLTKVIATAPSIMKLAESRRLSLDAPVGTYLSEFAGLHRDEVKIRHLLTHTSGLAPVVPRDFDWDGYATGIKLACAEPMMARPGVKWRYSDVNFILLGEIVRRVSGETLDVFAKNRLFDALGMDDTAFKPNPQNLPRIAPTTVMEDATPLHGTVHDPIARRMDGVAGHAGLFTTAADLAKFARMMLAEGVLPSGRRLFARETIRAMTQVQTAAHIRARRGFGWDIDSPYAGPRGAFPLGSYGHTGWTGTSIWIDPNSKSFLLFVSNRNHPTEKGTVSALRKDLANLIPNALPQIDFDRFEGTIAPLNQSAVARALRDFQNTLEVGTVKNGIDVLIDNEFAPFEGLKIGLITNHTGLARDERKTIDLLHQAPNVELKALFSPEHGIRGSVDEAVGDEKDKKTGLKVYSLYQTDRRKPNPDQLVGLDALVFDIQDIGCRFYTYVSTMGLCMEAAHEAGIKFFVLDRVNPIGGRTVQGPVLDGKSSFIGFHPIPVRHGMTAGELAMMFKHDRKWESLSLEVIKVQNWKRGDYFDETGLPWINPSPNMRSIEAAVLYPGIGLLEFTNISVGRGTRIPFELVGAPYIEPHAFAAALNAEKLPGVEFLPVHYTPDASVFKDERCGGVKILLTDRNQCPSVRVGIAMARTLRRLYPEAWKMHNFNKLLIHQPTFDSVANLAATDDTLKLWAPQSQRFVLHRNEFLLY
jgi:uncharacterized protein YbbC (DUF1343 family)/CubicO group peptidase (beta-lactamase class C family)